MMTTHKDDLPPFDLKGSLFTLTVLHLRQGDLGTIANHLADKVKQAPGFFVNAPVVIDLEALDDSSDDSLDFAGLYDLLRKQGLIPVGVRHGSPERQAAAVMAGLPVLPEQRPTVSSSGSSQGGESSTHRNTEPAAEKLTPPRRSRVHTLPVRSGQQIYAADGDLVILGAISPGAEVLADGNIHIYGPLRGRALAGVKGDTQARIFCQSLEAELVSIAGQYRVIEQLDASKQGKFVQIYLLDERLVIEPLYR